MKEYLKKGAAQVCLERDTGTVEISFGAQKKLCLRAKDSFDGVNWFAAAENWKSFEENGLTCAGFTVSASSGQGTCAGNYTFCIKEGVSAVLVMTRLAPDAAGKPELPFEWLRFETSGVHTVHTLLPRWSIKSEDMKIPISFRGNMVLESEEGCIGFFYGGEPSFDPKTNVARPDFWVETAGLTAYQPVHACVLAYGDNAAELENMQRAAGALYSQAKRLLSAEEPPFSGAEHRFESGPLAFVITTNEHGAALTGMKNIGVQTSFCLPLAQLCLKETETGREFTADSRGGWSTVRLLCENGGGRLQLSGIEGWPELALELEFTLIPAQRAVEWTSHVLNGESGLAVLSASYPPSPWSASKASCFVPAHCGFVAKDVMDIHFYRDGIYPRGWRFTMSYFAAYTAEKQNNGFYCGLHDPDGAYRTMNAETDPAEKTGLFFARCPAPGKGIGGNAFTLPGRLVWRMFDGDWYDATLIYKKFVHTGARWLPAIGAEGREDTPKWAKELPLWVMDWMPNTNPLAEPIPTSLRKNGESPPMEYWYEEPIKLQKVLGVPIGYHVYNWHWIPFNNDYPHYLPAKKEFGENLRKLQENNVRVMPYINARLWDTHDRAGDDWQFTAKAKAGATKDASGKLFTEKYESHEPDGSLCELSAMCPSSAVWKKQMAEVLGGLFGGLGVDGVYMDQIAAAAPYLCEDPTHNHLPGGGDWWAEQYNLLMRRSRQIKGENGFLSTEDNAEVYMKAMDGFLSWRWTLDHLVPAFSAIYAGYVVMFGRTTNGLKKGDEVFLKYETAEQLVFGGQLGWLNADVAERPRELEFLKKMAQLRWRYTPFFCKGEVLRPADIETDRPTKVTTPIYFDSQLFEAKQVLTGTWRLWDGTRSVLFIINCDTQKAEFTARLNAESAVMLEGAGAVSAMRRSGKELVICGTINPEDYLVLELTGAQ